MANHVVRKNGFKYTFYDDETYNLYMSGEADFDEGQTLRKRKGRGNICNRVKVEPDDSSIVVEKRPIIIQQTPEEHPYRDMIIDCIVDNTVDVINQCSDLLLKEGLPYLWHEKIKPGIDSFKEYKKNSWKTKAEMIIEEQQSQENISTAQLSANPKCKSTAKPSMTEKEILEEQRKAVLHYIGLLESLTKLHNAGVIDKNSALEQLTTPATIEQFNQALSSNPNLLEMTKSNEISKLLGRDLFQGGEFVPIEVNEIIELATVNDQEDI